MSNHSTTFYSKITGVSNVVFIWLVLLFVFLIPLSQYLSAKVLFLGVFVSFFTQIKSNAYTIFFKNSLDILFYLLVLVIGLFYSNDITSGLRVLETNLSLFAMPFIFCRLDEQKLKDVFLWFAIGLCVACSICLINATLVFFATGKAESFFFYKLTSVLDFQPTYYAYYLIFVITYGLFLLYYQLTKINTIIILTVVSFLFVFLMLTGGETAFVSMLLIFAFFILKFIVESKSKIKVVVVSFVGVMVLYMFATTVISEGDRNLQLDDAWDRLVVWQSGIAATPNLFIGVGTGDYKAVLNDYYLKHDLKKFATESYNSHNQFIQLLFVNGILGVVAFMALIGRPLYLSARSNNLLGILLIFPFLIYGMTEVFLGRYQGVVFFALMHQISILQARQAKLSISKPLH